MAFAGVDVHWMVLVWVDVHLYQNSFSLLPQTFLAEPMESLPLMHSF